MEEKEPKTSYMTIKEIISLLAEARTDIKFLKEKSLMIFKFKFELSHPISITTYSLASAAF